MSDPYEMGDLLARYQAGFNLLGRLTVLQHAERRVKHPLRIATHSSLSEYAASTDDAVMRVDFTLPSQGAIDYLRNLTPVTRQIFDGLARQYRNDAFTIAGVSDQRLIGKIRDALGSVLTDGGTKSDFHTAADKLTDDAGIQRLTAGDVENVFGNNVQRAYSSGRYEQMTEETTAAALPFWQYWTVGDGHVRPEHRALDGFIALQIDKVWYKIYPPCGYGCRCSVVALTQDEALDIDPKASDDGRMRLPAIAVERVPQAGYKNIFGL